ncbi:MAG: hypothetical protein OEL53_02300 [Rhodospirillales bacterium]|nr:hypothetical protein [Rhodospirillales bacterium]
MMRHNPDRDLLLGKKIDPRFAMPALHQALRIGIYDEFRAQEAYRAAMRRFGPVKPFVNIERSEGRHIAALASLLGKYRVPMPMNDWTDKIEVPADFAGCCALGMQAEIDNAAMYAGFLVYALPSDAVLVMTNLRDASWNNHLTAFRRCSGVAGQSGKGLLLAGLAVGAAALLYLGVKHDRARKLVPI